MENPIEAAKVAETAELHSMPLNNSNTIPIIDFSQLTSDDPHQRSAALQDLTKVCQDWGIFMIVNHGIEETLLKKVMDGMQEFFNLPEEDKHEYSEKCGLDPIRYSTSRFCDSNEKNVFWRDYIKVYNVQPHFDFPSKPQGYRETAWVYSDKVREIVRKILASILETLGLEERLLDSELELKSGVQAFKGNHYPPCPKPELAMGLAPHSDHGFLTLLIENQVGGLQIQHQGKWINAHALPNALIVFIGDHLEIFSNGKYKSCVHRAVVNNKVARISITANHGPSFDTIVSPSSSLIQKQNIPPAYKPIKYKDYLELQQSNLRDYGKTTERIKIPT